MSRELVPSAPDPGAPLPSYGRLLWTAAVVIATLLVAAVGWGMFARLDSAVVSRGVVLAESERKTVQHLEGGILEELLVAPGERVRRGQPVARLDATSTRELLAQLRHQRAATALERWRLQAERDHATTLDRATAPTFDEAPRDLLGTQLQLFEARRRAHEGAIRELRGQIEQLRAEIEASAGRARAAERQLASLGEEHEMIAQLVARQAAPRIRLLELERRMASHEGERDEHDNLAAAARKRIQQAQLKIETLEQQRRVDIAEGLDRTQRELVDLESRIRAAEDVLRRHVVRAPQDGTVVDLRIVTPGGVIRPGEPIMDLVPSHDRLIVRTRLAPEAIDTVYVGRSARIRLTAYKRSRAPVVDAEVVYVSADLLEDERDGSMYYEARLVLDDAALAELDDVEITTGMPAEVMIQTGERRAGDYFVEPFTRHLRRAFVEE